MRSANEIVFHSGEGKWAQMCDRELLSSVIIYLKYINLLRIHHWRGDYATSRSDTAAAP